MASKSYSAPWGARVWVITLAFLAFIVAVSVSLPLLLGRSDLRPVAWVMPAVLSAIAAGTSLFTVRSFEISDQAIVVNRLIWSNCIPLATLDSAEVDANAAGGAWKTVGNDGLFAMHGRFRSKRLGKFQAYVTNLDNAVVLRGPGETVVVSPETPGALINEFYRRKSRVEVHR